MKARLLTLGAAMLLLCLASIGCEKTIHEAAAPANRTTPGAAPISLASR